MIQKFEDFINESKTVMLTFNGLDRMDRIIYKGDDGDIYKDVEGVIYAVSDGGEPEYPVKNVKVKKGEVIYNPKDRFNRKLNTFQE